MSGQKNEVFKGRDVDVQNMSSVLGDRKGQSRELQLGEKFKEKIR